MTRLRNSKQIGVVLLFPSAVRTASGSKGISQHKAPLKFFVNVNIKNLKDHLKRIKLFQLTIFRNMVFLNRYWITLYSSGFSRVIMRRERFSSVFFIICYSLKIRLRRIFSLDPTDCGRRARSVCQTNVHLADCFNEAVYYY